ncbi:hypothetical protein IFM89_026912 [Coptis chinensis]|uniref:Transmembrane protein n=1 Tax=Coptis chinensis TaxID=261450 RepID=A0A835J0Q7_9MAGN|nr:hypothetical protein IFM89_026912 [Coptis chinensis]
MEEKREISEEEQVHYLVKDDWQQIPFEAHQQVQAHQSATTREWEMVENDVFPPSNHEGLHIPRDTDQTYNHHVHVDVDVDVVVEQEQHGPPAPQTEPLDLRVMRKLRLGYEVIWSKILRLVYLARYYYYARTRVNLSFLCMGGGFTVAWVLGLWYFRWQRWRRQSRDDKIEHLIILLGKQDEKISQLVDQISQLNHLLSTRRRVPILRSV